MSHNNSSEWPNNTKRQNGVSLIIVLIMLVIIGLTSAAAIRSATSGEKVTNNIRLQILAQQYAEAALRYCENQLEIPDDGVAASTRAGNLAEANIRAMTTSARTADECKKEGDLAWQCKTAWTGTAGEGLAASRTKLPVSEIKSIDSSFIPKTLPECVVEWSSLHPSHPFYVPPDPLPGTLIGTPPEPPRVYVVTARGFSPDYTANATTGKTTNGSVVWLQSTVLY